MERAYSAIASHYDSLMTDFDYEKYYDFVKSYATGKVLELACGSGMFTALLLRSAESVVAVDSSAEMLNIARARNLKSRRYVTFVESDMLEYECIHKYDNAFAVCDGLNYIAVNDIPSLAVKVNRSINMGGRFIFDVSTPHKLRDIIGDNIFYEDGDDITYLWTNELGADSVRMELAVFERDGEVYRRRDEEHLQYIHSMQSLSGAMIEAGFELEVMSGEGGKASEEDSRWIFVCEKVREV